MENTYHAGKELHGNMRHMDGPTDRKPDRPHAIRTRTHSLPQAGLLTQWILFTSQELDRFVDECIIDNGGSYFDIWCDDYYVVMNKGDDSFDDVLEIPLIGERKTTSGLENCSIWWG